MDESDLKKLLDDVAKGVSTSEEALAAMKHWPAQMLGCAHVDHQRRLRTGFPEVVFGENKSAEQIVDIMKQMLLHSKVVMATRVSPGKAEAVQQELSELEYHAEARMLTSRLGKGSDREDMPLVLVVSAGTSDIPVAEEALLTARCFGHRAEYLYDVGVAGIHRLLSQKDLLDKAAVLIVVAGMEGALPSVVGGLVDKPVIAVPTSVGYGTGFGGIAALLGMLNSCAPGVAVVNIDNGFGAGCMAASIVRQME